MYIGFVVLGLVQGCKPPQENLPPAPGYETIARRLEVAIRYELDDKGIPGFSIALVDGDRIVWAQGFGYAHPDRKIPATARTVYRVASISKLFTALAVMQLVEQGVLDLDTDVRTYLPDFHPEDSFEAPITLRQLLSHRSGQVREPPVGHYFDPTEPSLQATVYSLNETRRVYPPETRTKYSNAAVSVAGFVVEQVTGRPFADYVQQALLEPMGMRSSAFTPRPELQRRLATGYMWTYDGRRFEAPVFELGILPAANLYTTVTDLGRFLITLFRKGETEQDTPIVTPASLETMWTIQYADSTQTQGFGLGFYLSRFRGHRRFQHSGVMYGYASRVYGLPDVQLGVAAVGTLDATNVVTDRLAEYALDLLLAYREGRPLPDYPRTEPVTETQARRLAGRYRQGTRYLDLFVQDSTLYARLGEVVDRVRRQGDTLIVDGRLTYGLRWQITDRGLQAPDGTTWERADDPVPAPMPERWRPYIGRYGWPHNTLYILEQDGHLYALIEWFFYYPLIEVGPDEFRMPDYGLYMGERVAFVRTTDGRVAGVRIGGVFWERWPETDTLFRIQPIRPVAELMQEVQSLQPPTETGPFQEVELVDLQQLDPTIRLDLRYATADNFLGTPLYRTARALLQRPAAEALVRVQQRLRRLGLGLIIHDAYRPWYVTWMMWEATPDSLRHFVADPAHGSRHNRGCAVDVSLYDLKTGQPVEMPSGYDEFTERAYAHYPGGTHRQRWYRERLREAMEAEGFRVYPWEWWHYDCQDWQQYPLLNFPIEAAP
ncbi:serine hydrolase [Rhodothermus profundi]|uniref:D-alanyl-D-alanine dipeptidase n=1 Tax=Rhodothermus profundi TaxID=633813 RepID=A0A1M6SGQ6_9BACT|nr:serine hydrolase [Rhodothermus profundi]SHK43668.1 D-alanyl-D-alanine dipeptidase [Rhodothermus profundi]